MIFEIFIKYLFYLSDFLKAFAQNWNKPYSNNAIAAPYILSFQKKILK